MNTPPSLFYSKVESVSKDRHIDLCVKTGEDYSFAKNLNTVLLTAIEFPLAAREYPIIFTGNLDHVVPAIILGTSENENLFLNSQGEWKGKYIPMFIRRYPFIFSTSEESRNMTLCIDEEFSGCNRKGIGERLFDSDGKHTQYLKNVVKFLEKYQSHFRQTEVFCQKLLRLELLESITAHFNLAEGQHRSFTGIYGINRDKLNSLSSGQLSDLAQTDDLELAFLHLQSLRNFSTIQEKVLDDFKTKFDAK